MEPADVDGESSSTDADNRTSNSSIGMEKPQQSGSQQQWCDQFSDHHHHQKKKINNNTSSGTGVNRLRKSSSSYPDLRQDSFRGIGGGDHDRFRCFDDFELNRHRSTPASGNSVHRRRQSMEEVSAPPPPPPLPVQRQRPRRTTYGKSEEKAEVKKTGSAPLASTSPPTPPPPPPPPPKMRRSEEEFVSIERKKSNATKEMKMVLASIDYQKQKTKTTYEDSIRSPPSFLNSSVRHPPPSLPPPPPPPPPSVFYNPLKKDSKSRIVHSVTSTPPPFQSSMRQSKIQPQSTPSPPPPAPPPPPPPPFQSSKRQSKIQPQSTTSEFAGDKFIAKYRQGLRGEIKRFYDRYENVNSGGRLPLIPMPPPPPPPFCISGDSFSSRSCSPELEYVDFSSKERASDGIDGGYVAGPSVSCPSPDLNIQADSFIARLRDERKLEKINSLKGKQKLGHGLGP